MRYVNDTLLNQADATQTSQTSQAIDASSYIAASIVAIAAGGTITGTLVVQASNDLLNPTNWVAIPSQTVSVTGAGVFIIPKFDVSYQWLRIVYTKTTSAAGALITGIIKSVGF
jgi:hypothetical protein